jgi:23S rRNA pseudouridine955/2504/2580 synthase
MSQETPSNQVRQFVVGRDDDGIRLDRWFKRHLPQIGFATISRWARTGQIRVDGKRAAPEDRVAKGQTLRVPPGDSIVGIGGGKGVRARKPLTEAQLELADSIVLHRDPSAIVINKPPGLATQGGSGTFEHVDGLLDAYAPNGPRPRLVHRLDKDTSGVLLVAATPGSAAFFSKRFSGRTAKKVYWALVVGVPSIDEGLIDLPLAKQPGSGGEKMMVDQSEHGQPSRSRYRVIDRAGNRCCWVELQPLTGRTHQLRVHMAAIGHPIVGDGKYGGPDAFLSGSISRKLHLHARRLIIDHPDGTPLDVEAPLPDHMAASLVQLGFEESEGEYIPDPTGEWSREERRRRPRPMPRITARSARANAAAASTRAARAMIRARCPANPWPPKSPAPKKVWAASPRSSRPPSLRPNWPASPPGARRVSLRANLRESPPVNPPGNPLRREAVVNASQRGLST